MHAFSLYAVAAIVIWAVVEVSNQARPEPVPVSELAAECRRVMPMCAVSMEAD